ncbi:Trihelix transcription factor GT-2-like protein [Melia azedarach]|uniref:Trihelix transcription factor GT-2-like protein n=1 Tax=Melia azedarach TaxID=155640 RepID=A0ACC1WY03_MELAZ|nr:Trihelix transcription factor GT-2-like protein [Melia azedarach]
MEVLTGDRENEFPQQITPFPEPLDLPTALESANVPPQKLRPIRRSPTEDRPSFLGKQTYGVTGESGEHFDGAAKIFGSDLGEEDDSSSSSDDNHEDLLTETIVPENRKRKRKTTEKIEIYLESMVMKIMEKQEQMNRELIEMIERRERERIIREEAWKQQEMERTKRDEEIRARETDRSIALITFIQSVLGQEIQVPQALPVSCMEEDGGRDSGNHTKHNIMCKENNRRCQEASDPNKRWPEAEIQALITLRTTLEHKFHVTGSKCSIWDEISVGMRNMGYDRSAKKCKEKWENMNKYFRKSMENGKKHVEKSKSCPYFHDLEVLYRNGLINPGNVSNFPNFENVSESDASNTNHETASKTEKE